jgi:hypothetical protein
MRKSFGKRPTKIWVFFRKSCNLAIILMSTDGLMEKINSEFLEVKKIQESKSLQLQQKNQEDLAIKKNEGGQVKIQYFAQLTRLKPSLIIMHFKGILFFFLIY